MIISYHIFPYRKLNKPNFIVIYSDTLFNHPYGLIRMKKWVEEINLPQEYKKLRTIVRSVNVYRESETVLPGKNYWSTYL